MQPKTRTIDDLGRVAIPSELREEQDWNVRDVIEFYCEGDTIVMRKAVNGNEE